MLGRYAQPTDEYENWLGNHPDLPEDIQNLFGELADKLQELRARIKTEGLY